MTRRRFISFEGSEGCGKTTQIALLRERLEQRGETVLLTREPGGTLLGEAIRHLLKHAREGQNMAAEAELLLFNASRAELVRKEILPALDSGAWVLSDRFGDSSVVYQGIARGLGMETVRQVVEFATGGLKPGLTFLLDLDPKVASRRIRRRPQPVDRIEKEGSAFFAKVRDGFLSLAQAEPDRIRTIDTTEAAAAVFEVIWKEVSHAFSL
ncbi:MAG: dTMP kinase [Verrucomicrobium sp.]|nr:dTMP kinase [Verrucomicrobium sp.]